MGKLTIGLTRFLPLCALLLVFPAITAAFPIAIPDTEGLEVIVSSTGPVVATYQGNSALFSNDLYLMLDGSGNPGDDGNPANDRFLFNNHTSPVGSTATLGSFPVGTTLIFRLHVNDTGTDYFTGPGSRNPDGQPHARAQADWMPSETLVSFEDYVDFAYNDLSFSFIPTTAIPSISDKPQGKALNLIVFVHGCCTNQEDVNILREELSETYKALLQKSGEWEIVLWDWYESTPVPLRPPILPIGPPFGLIEWLSEYADNFIEAADQAYEAAAGEGGEGQKLADAIAAVINQSSINAYEYVHFIGHSAGAKLIHEASTRLAEDKNLKKRPFIHITFLDAYTRDTTDTNSYGSLADYAEHYVHKSYKGLFSPTDACLSKAFDFDITSWPPSLQDLSLFGHQWPRHWYQKSVTTSGFKYGFPLSLEGSGKDINELVNELAKYPAGQQCPLSDVNTNCQPAACWE